MSEAFFDELEVAPDMDDEGHKWLLTNPSEVLARSKSLYNHQKVSVTYESMVKSLEKARGDRLAIIASATGVLSTAEAVQQKIDAMAAAKLEANPASP